VIDVHDLPAVNASLNGTAAVLLAVGYVLIRRGRVAAHRNMMVSAFVVSTLFLACYLYYHAHVLSKPYEGTGVLRPVYYAILISHIALAGTIVPLALVTLYRAFRGQFDRHRRIARWTLPLWLYVSVTGVVIYLMLYRF
jgi:uncharacterized membrane protein YozB (DUF420 family)